MTYSIIKLLEEINLFLGTQNYLGNYPILRHSRSSKLSTILERGLELDLSLAVL